MSNIEQEFAARIKQYGDTDITFIDYISIVDSIFDEQKLTRDPEVFAKVIQKTLGNEILDIENIIKSYKFDAAREKSSLFFDKFDSLDNEFAKQVVRNLDISTPEKNIFLAVLNNENGVADFIANKCIEFNSFSENLKKNVEELILSDEMHEKLSKKLPLNSEDASFFLFFDYVRQQVLPSMNHESVMKFYMYAESGNFEKDLKEDPQLKNAFINKDSKEIQEVLFKKIKESQIGLKLDHPDKSSDFTAKIVISKLPESYMEKTNRSTPSGFIDYAIFDANDSKKVHIVNVKAATIESDIYAHDEKSVIADRALKNWSRLNDYSLVIHESQGSHRKEKILKHFLKEEFHDLDNEDFSKVKEVLDTVINRLVDNYNGTKKNIIQPGDCKYTTEHLDKQPAYKVFIELAKMINDDQINLNTSNDSIFKVVSKSVNWLSRNLSVDAEFLSNEENVKELRHELKGLRNKFSDKDLLVNSIKRLLSDTTPTVIEQKTNEARLNRLERTVKEEKSFLSNVSYFDLITKKDADRVVAYKNNLFKFTVKLAQSFISLEKDNRSNAIKMERIKEKYSLMFNSAHSVRALIEDGEKIYFSSPQFKARENYQKDIEALFKITENDNGVLDNQNVEKSLAKVIKELRNDTYTDLFDNVNNGVLTSNKFFFLNNMKEEFIQSAKELIKRGNELMPEIKNNAAQRYKTQIEPNISILNDQSKKIAIFQDKYDDEGEIKTKDVIELEKSIRESEKEINNRGKFKVKKAS